MTPEQITSIIEYKNFQSEFFVWQMDSANQYESIKERMEKFYNEEIELDEDDEKTVALMQHTGNNFDESYSDIDKNYNVYTDEEADEAWEESLKHYCEEFVISELPDSAKYYFNEEEWIEDAKMYGRGHALGTYDGNEYEETVKGTTYYLFKI